MSWLVIFSYFFSTGVSFESEVRITLLNEGKGAQKLMTREFFGEEFKRIEAEENEKRK
ncbi:MAG: hypothetical protein ACI9FG_000918 [Crocinitomicaceae bacterium]|jgi:hypothetical protein